MLRFARGSLGIASSIVASLFLCAGCGAAIDSVVNMPDNVEPKADASAFGAGYDNLLRARAIIEASARAHGALSRQPGPMDMISIAYTGTLRNKGHYAKPKQEKDFALSGVYEYWLSERAAIHKGELREVGGDPKVLTAETIVRGARVSDRDYGDEKPVEVPASSVQKARAELFWLLPQAILERALERVESLRWLGEHAMGGALHDVICFTDIGGSTWNLFVDTRTRYLTRVERLVAHPVEGDAVEWFEFEGYRTVSGLVLPSRRRDSRLEDWSTYTREIHYDRIEFGAPPAAPAKERFTLATTAAPGGEAAEPQPKVVDLGKGINLIELPEENCKVLFAVFSDHVVVLEAPLSSATGERILAAVRQAAPGKPVRYLMMSHHHPHYTGGLRPFVHAGATLVTTAGNRDYIASIARRPQRIEPDALEREPRDLQMITVSGSKVFEDAAQRLEVYDVGPLSDHTDEYLVFYFPAKKLLFEGDLGRLPLGEPDASTAKRAARVLRIVSAIHVPVEQVVQSWPLAGQKTVATIAELEAWSKLGDGR